jgi:hypothetical protein
MASRERIGSAGTKVLSPLILAIGVLIVVRTVAAGGGPLSFGVMLGLVFIAIGAGRFYLSSRSAG